MSQFVFILTKQSLFVIFTPYISLLKHLSYKKPKTKQNSNPTFSDTYVNDCSDNLSRINAFELNKILIKTFLQAYYNCLKCGSQWNLDVVQLTQKLKVLLLILGFWGRFLVERRDSNEATSNVTSAPLSLKEEN